MLAGEDGRVAVGADAGELCVAVGCSDTVMVIPSAFKGAAIRVRHVNGFQSHRCSSVAIGSGRTTDSLSEQAAGMRSALQPQIHGIHIGDGITVFHSGLFFDKAGKPAGVDKDIRRILGV